MPTKVAQDHIHISSGFWGRDLIILTLLIGVFYGFMLGSRPLSVPDEGRYVEIPREMVMTGDYLTPRLNSVKYFEKPPLFYWLQSVSIRLFGLNEWALRLWPALFALLGCLAVYGAGRKLYGRRSGLISAAVLATSPLYYALSRNITLDMTVSVLLAAALLAFLLGRHEPPGLRRRLFLWGFYVFAALATLTKGLIGILIPGIVIGAWIVVMNGWRLMKNLYLPSGIALFLLIAAPWHILVSRANPEFFNFYFVHEHFLRYMTKIHHRYRPVWFFIPVLLLGLFPWTAFLVQSIKHGFPSSWRMRHEHGDAIFLMLWTSLVFLFFSASSSKLIPYILPIFPPLAILIGHYLAAAWDGQNVPFIRASYAMLVIAALVLAAALIALPYYRTVSEVQRLGVNLYSLALILVAGTVVTWLLKQHRGFGWAFSSLTVSTVLFLTILNADAAFLHIHSVKDLASVLKPRLHPSDEVVSFRTYYQDLPVYLERRITVVEWKGELEFGAKVEDTSQWMIDEATFWRRWQSPATVYMLTSRKMYDELRRDPLRKFYLLAQNDRSVLLTNREMNHEISAAHSYRSTAQRRSTASTERGDAPHRLF